MPERFKFRHVHAITGTFVLVAVGVLIVAVAWTGHTQRWFRRNVTLRIILPESGAAGIRQGSEVYFLGTLVGTVSDVDVDPAARMEARVSILRDFFRFLRADSSAAVKKTFGVAGDAYFELARGQGQPLSEKQARIVCKEPPASALESAVDEIRLQALAALKKTSAGLDAWTALGSNLVTTQERLDQLIARGDQIAADLQRGKGTAGKLLTDSSTADQLNRLLVEANHSLGELQGTLTNLQEASVNLQAASTNLPAVSSALRNEAKDLPGLVMQTQIAMRELERLIEAIQRHWLVRKYVNRTNPPPLRPLPANEEPQKKPGKALHSPKDRSG
jgi:phospholipid/cholesterol/gamma-HCH transport system substrate-binding protein